MHTQFSKVNVFLISRNNMQYPHQQSCTAPTFISIPRMSPRIQLRVRVGVGPNDSRTHGRRVGAGKTLTALATVVGVAAHLEASGVARHGSLVMLPQEALLREWGYAPDHEEHPEEPGAAPSDGS